MVTVLYILANIAYLAGATKQEITTSGQLIAALLFKNVYGPQAERILDIFVAMSALGNVLSVVRRLVWQNEGSTTFLAAIFSRSCQSSARSGRHPTLRRLLGFQPAF